MPAFSYDPARGVLYARNFALSDLVPPDQQLFFYSADDNCTNFISQCVWAAYGGWLPGFDAGTVAENRRRILADVRQVKGVWYGSRAHIGSLAWVRVEDFYRLCTQPGARLGPRAERLSEGTPSALDFSRLRLGDVIQLVVKPYAPSRFGHGLFVTQAGGSADQTLICSQTQDRLDVPLSWFLQYPDIYPRQRTLRFSAADFAS